MIGLSTQFNLFVTTQPANHIAEFCLTNEHGAQLGFQQTDFKSISASHCRGIFDLRNYVNFYVASDGVETLAALEGIGITIADEVLGQEIFEKLWEGNHQRTLCVHLPAAGQAQDFLAALLARVPWEIAKPNIGAPSLGDRNLLVRVSHDMAPPPYHPVTPGSEEALRILFVFAEAQGSRPLSARKERRELLQLFKREIYPKRRVVAHFLTHGVTRERLIDQIQQHGGYHIVHWSGHGTLNLLELARPGGAKDNISGDELLALFNRAGGFLPQLIYLSACQSGDSLQVHDWHDFFSIAQGNEANVRRSDSEPADIKTQPNTTGTAYALMSGGVPSVVAMRFAVSDDYARELAVKFYRALLADIKPKDAAAALNLARKELASKTNSGITGFAICDHATAVLYGSEQPGLSLVSGRSPSTHIRERRLHQIGELSPASHEHFVGRTWELAGLGADFIGSRDGQEIKPVALISGLGGMGKTALVAEVLDLWTERFDHVLLYQAKPTALAFEATLRDIHLKLADELGTYWEHVQQFPANAIFRDATSDFTGSKRTERLIRNLVEALKQEAVLLVFDNFESNLKPQPEIVDGKPLWACKDHTWDRCLEALTTGLAEAPSRVLITSRHPLLTLASDLTMPILLGPLPPGEAALYLRARPVLSQMATGSTEERMLAVRLLNASRFHPLLMDRLSRLVAAPELHEQLFLALETLEKTRDFANLPDIFATATNGSNERAYLHDALATSLDLFIQHVGVNERLLLWMITAANEPVTLDLLGEVWRGENQLLETLRHLNLLLQAEQDIPAEWQDHVTPELVAMLADLPPGSIRPEIEPLLQNLIRIGLVTAQTSESDNRDLAYSCHELVRERIDLWMREHPNDRGGLSENAIRRAYADRLEAYFDAMQHHDLEKAIYAGSHGLIYCVQAQAWEQMDGFASRLVTSISNTRLIEGLIPHLRTAAESAPEDHLRLSFISHLADALSTIGEFEASSAFFEQAVDLARKATETSDDTIKAWHQLAMITCNWGVVHSALGNFDAARRCYLESTEAEKKADSPAIKIIINELAILKLDIKEGGIDKAAPQVAERLERVHQWWLQYKAGQLSPEAPDIETLARTIIGALDIAADIDMAKENWESALSRLDTMIDIKRSLARSTEEIATSRFNRAGVLMQLPNHLTEARSELEACYEIFKDTARLNAKVVSALSYLAEKQDDLDQAITLARRALILHERMPDPEERANSHNNLASYLARRGDATDHTEQRHHRLASLIYTAATGSARDLSLYFVNYAKDLQNAHSVGTAIIRPIVRELVNAPDFDALAIWLKQRDIDLTELQALIDSLFDQILKAYLNIQSFTGPTSDD